MFQIAAKIKPLSIPRDTRVLVSPEEFGQLVEQKVLELSHMREENRRRADWFNARGSCYGREVTEEELRLIAYKFYLGRRERDEAADRGEAVQRVRLLYRTT